VTRQGGREYLTDAVHPGIIERGVTLPRDPWPAEPEGPTIPARGWLTSDAVIRSIMHHAAHDHRYRRGRPSNGVVHAGPMTIPTSARLAVLGDPQGAIFAIFEGDVDD
jgi:hypothetical protein